MAIGTTAALIGSAAIGTAGSLASGAMGSKAAGKAADAQTRAAEASAQVQRDSITQSRIDAFPWAYQGAQALYSLMDEIGVSRPVNPILPDLNSGPFAPNPQQQAQPQPQVNALGQTAPQSVSAQNPASRFVNYREFEQAQQGQPVQPQAVQQSVPGQQTSTAQPMELTARRGFQETPGYQFQVEEGEKAVTNNLAALGMKNSGAALKALTRFRTGLANQEYGTYLNRLAAAAGMGQSQVNTTNALTQNAASNIGNTLQDAGAARASGYVGSANAWGNALGGVANNVSNALGMLSYRPQQFPAAPGGLY